RSRLPAPSPIPQTLKSALVPSLDRRALTFGGKETNKSASQSLELCSLFVSTSPSQTYPQMSSTKVLQNIMKTKLSTLSTAATGSDRAAPVGNLRLYSQRRTRER